MRNEKYMQALYALNHAFDEEKKLIIEWKNGLAVKCVSYTGMYETDVEPEEEGYAGDYAAAVTDVEVLAPGRDDSIFIYNNDAIEIDMNSIPAKISLEDGTVLWTAEGGIVEPRL